MLPQATLLKKALYDEPWLNQIYAYSIDALLARARRAAGGMRAAHSARAQMMADRHVLESATPPHPACDQARGAITAAPIEVESAGLERRASPPAPPPPPPPRPRASLSRPS